MEFYHRGNWIVGTPVWVFPEQEMDDRIAKMICPHPEWAELGREVEQNPEDGIRYLVVTEKCPACGALRMRLLPEGAIEEPFDYSIPESGPWYERLYNLGNFVMLVRRYQNNPNVPPSFMTRIETPSGNVHTGTIQIPTLLFSPAAVEQLVDMERVIKLGPDRYAAYRILKEGRKTKEERDDIKMHTQTLDKIIQEIGPESIAAAKTLLEAEVDHEIEDMKQYQAAAIAEQAEQETQEMEKQVEEPKARARKKKSKKGK